MRRLARSIRLALQAICPNCEGSGDVRNWSMSPEALDDHRACDYCGGSGRATLLDRWRRWQAERYWASLEAEAEREENERYAKGVHLP